MPSHITIPELQDLLERFMKENPYGDSLELAEFMYNAGHEAGEKGATGGTESSEPDKGAEKDAETEKNSEPERETYYQPVSYSDDGTNLAYGDIPWELFSFQVFRTEEDCMQWLREHGYEPGDWVIFEYHDNEIEDHAYIDPND